MINFIKKHRYDILSILLGIILFFIVYGLKVINPTYDDWIYNKVGDDINQHYIGWQYFRKTEWQYPIGLLDGLGIEPVSIVYTDSIPILAIIFKVLSPLLPDTFQYLGIWGVLCFALQSLISFLILRKITGNQRYSIVGSVFFTLSSVVLARMFGHTALAGNWIILLAVLVYICRNNFKSLVTKNIAWILVCCLSITIHMYFLPMVFGIMCSDILEDMLNKKSMSDCIIGFSANVGVSLFMMYSLGMFYGDNKSLGSSSLGSYISNLNAFFNSGRSENSIFLEPLKNMPNTQMEGYAYIGLGLILGLILVSVLGVIYLIKTKCKYVKEFFSIHWRKIVSIGTVVFTSAFFAISPTIYFGDKLLLSINYPNFIFRILSIFRANGRFMWIPMYITMFLILYLIYKLIKDKHTLYIIISLLLMFQVADYSNKISRLNVAFNKDIEFASTLKNDLWNELGNSRKHIEVVPVAKEYLSQTDFYYAITQYALQYDMDISSFIIARSSYDEYFKHSQKIIDELQNGIPNYDTIYIFNDGKYIPNRDNFRATIIDGYTIGYFV